MSIIGDRITIFSKTENKYYELLSELAQLSELELYLHNLDCKARLEQVLPTQDLKQNIKTLERDRKQIMQSLHNRIEARLLNTNINNDDFITFVNEIQESISNDADINNMTKHQATKACKLYLVSSIVADILTKNKSQTLSR